MGGGRTRWAAHRGGAALWPENSLLAFRQALALGAPLLELDVHVSADGEVVVIHDATIERTTEGRGSVAATPAAALCRLRLRGPDGALTEERVPLLGDVLRAVAASPAGLLVEIKGPGPGVRWERRGGVVRPIPGPRYEGLEAKTLAALGGAGLGERANVMAFDPAVLAEVRALDPGRRTTLLVARAHVERAGARPQETVTWAAATGVTDLGLEHTLVDEAVVEAAHKAGIALGAWTVNEESAMRGLIALGVDVLTTDRPDLARELLGGAS